MGLGLANLSFSLNGNTVGIENQSPAHEAIMKLKENQKAKDMLKDMKVEVSALSGCLNIFNSTREDMMFFSEILGNPNCTYMGFIKLSSFYY
jgi:hypothetical protein